MNKIDSALYDLSAPSPTITLMGDLNFNSSVITWHVVDGVLLPRVAGHRVRSDEEGGQVRQQAAQLCDLAARYHLTQQVNVATREREILDLVWSSNPDLVSNIQVDTFADITDHSVVTATTSYRLGSEECKQQEFLLESGKRLWQLDFSKAPWTEIQTRLRQMDWGALEDTVKDSVTAGHALFMNMILPVMEELVPLKVLGKRFGNSRKHKNRRCLWRKLARVKNKLYSSCSVHKATGLLKTKQLSEKELKMGYDEQGRSEENKVVNAMKSNPKSIACIWQGKAENKS